MVAADRSADESRLGPLPVWAVELVERSRAAGEDIPSALRIAADTGRVLPFPGRGQTLQRWTVLAALSRANLTVGRVVEAHTDALAILDEAGEDESDTGTWGVFAAESPGATLTARLTRTDEVRLCGVKPWCSLGDTLDHALVTADVAGGRQLFRVNLDDPSVHPEPAKGWIARGLRTVTSVPVSFDETPARPVGNLGWYLTRPGFAWGGIGVAACWHGGAEGLAATLTQAAGRRGGELNSLHVGIAASALHASAAVLADAARRVDDGSAGGPAGELLALQVRAVVADAAERVLRSAAHALGPAPLAFDAEHAARVADLGLYVRQHHAERDLAALGARLTDGDGPP